MLPGPRGAQRVQPNVILAVLSLAALTYSILSSAVIPALPTIQHSLHASETGITWLLTGFLLSASVGTAIIGVGGGLGLVVGGLIDEHLNWHWLFWIPLPVMVAAAVCTWRYIPESQVRSPGRVNWAAAALMTTGMSCLLIAI